MVSQSHVATYSAKIRYLASTFVDAQSIIPNTSDMAALLAKLNDEQLIPGSAQEVSAAGVSTRIAFATPDGTRQLLLLGNRFDYSKISTTPEGADLGEFSEFCQDAIVKLTTVLGYFQRRAHRLAAVQEGYLQDMPAGGIDKIRGQVLNLPPVYLEHVPSEWDWRAVAHIEREIGGVSEPTNTITTIKRTVERFIRVEAGVPVQLETDRIRIDFDINTLPTNVNARFEAEHVHSFFEQASQWHANLSSEVLSFIFGG